MTVECSNCGGADWATILLSGGALAVALVALWITLREHRAFMRQASARALLTLTFRPLAADADGVIRREREGAFEAIVEVGISNEGDKAATGTTLNVLVP